MDVFLTVLTVIAYVIGGAVAVILVLIALLCFLRLDVCVYADTGTEPKVRLSVRAGPVKVRILPRKKKTAEKKPDRQSGKRNSSGKKKEKKKIPVGIGDIPAFVEMFRDEVLCGVWFRRLHGEIAVGGDADEAALNYGRISAAVFPVLGALDSSGKIEDGKFSIYPDFTAQKTKAKISAELSVRVFRLIKMLIRAGVYILKKRG